MLFSVLWPIKFVKTKHKSSLITSLYKYFIHALRLVLLKLQFEVLKFDVEKKRKNEMIPSLCHLCPKIHDFMSVLRKTRKKKIFSSFHCLFLLFPTNIWANNLQIMYCSSATGSLKIRAWNGICFRLLYVVVGK